MLTDGYRDQPTILAYSGDDVQYIERELPRVEYEFESDGFANTPVYAACLVR